MEAAAIVDPLANVRSMIVIFVLDGCEACDEYKPRFETLVAEFQQHGHPFVYYDEGMTIPQGSIPVLVLDAASEDASVTTLADKHKVDGLPTTLMLSRMMPSIKLVGASDDAEIYETLKAACLANR